MDKSEDLAAEEMRIGQFIRWMIFLACLLIVSGLVLLVFTVLP